MLTVLEKVSALQKVPLFQAVRTESLARVAAIAHETSYQPNEPLYRQNEVADRMFVVVDGQVALQRNGNESVKVGSRQSVGDLAMLSGDSFAETAVADSPCTVLVLDQQEFQDAMADDFGLAGGVLRSVARAAASGGSGA